MIAPNIYLTHYLHLRFILDSVFSIKIFLVSWTRISALALSLCLISAWCVCFVPQSFLTLYNSLDWSPPGFSVHGILQARILEWVAISFSTVSPCFLKIICLCVSLFNEIVNSLMEEHSVFHLCMLVTEHCFWQTWGYSTVTEMKSESEKSCPTL